MKDKAGFIQDMRWALDALQAAMERHPEHAQSYLPACVHIEAAMNKLMGDAPVQH